MSRKPNQTSSIMARYFYQMLILVLLTQGSKIVAAGADLHADGELDPQRISQIEAMLSAQPAGFGRPIADRIFWASAKTREQFRSNIVAEAESLLRRKFPAWNDTLYLEFSRNGNRPPGERMLRQRHGWLYPLVLAECLEDQGRFLPLLNKVLREYTRERTWVLPAHDWELVNFRGERCTVDLASSAFAADLAQNLYWLGDRLDPAVRKDVATAIDTRIFAAFKRSLATGHDAFWLGSTNDPVKNNWNAVCLAGVVSAARTILPDRHDRAVFLAAGEHYSRYFINGFREDGYCDEGAGYWAYGFGNFVLLREALVNATGGQIDLFAQPKIRRIAEYGVHIQMTDGLAPPFADCRFGTVIDPELLSYCRQTLGLEVGSNDAAGAVNPLHQIAFLFMSQTPPPNSSGGATKDIETLQLRSFFDQAGVLLCRPADGQSSCLSAAIKAGGNGSHSHNDIGSFVIAVQGKQVVGDPGGPYAYDDKTFGPHRFDRKLLNSYGHSVPVVGGQLQLDATKIQPKVIGTNFTGVEDEIEIDLKPAYPVATLKNLVRTMRFSRQGEGRVTIEDTVSFSRPEKFEAAIQTPGSIRRTGEHSFEFTFEGRRLSAEVQTADGFEVSQERITEMGAPTFTRLGMKLKKPITDSRITITFRPLTSPR